MENAFVIIIVFGIGNSAMGMVKMTVFGGDNRVRMSCLSINEVVEIKEVL